MDKLHPAYACIAPLVTALTAVYNTTTATAAPTSDTATAAETGTTTTAGADRNSTAAHTASDSSSNSGYIVSVTGARHLLSAVWSADLKTVEAGVVRLQRQRPDTEALLACSMSLRNASHVPRNALTMAYRLAVASVIVGSSYSASSCVQQVFTVFTGVMIAATQQC
jgi:hypothetical protein